MELGVRGYPGRQKYHHSNTMHFISEKINMGKPLLTEDIIEQAKRGEIDLEEHPYYEDYDQEFYDEDYEADYQPSAYKSRRIESLNAVISTQA